MTDEQSRVHEGEVHALERRATSVGRSATSTPGASIRSASGWATRLDQAEYPGRRRHRRPDAQASRQGRPRLQPLAGRDREHPLQRHRGRAGRRRAACRSRTDASTPSCASRRSSTSRTPRSSSRSSRASAGRDGRVFISIPWVPKTFIHPRDPGQPRGPRAHLRALAARLRRARQPHRARDRRPRRSASCSGRRRHRPSRRHRWWRASSTSSPALFHRFQFFELRRPRRHDGLAASPSWVEHPDLVEFYSERAHASPRTSTRPSGASCRGSRRESATRARRRLRRRRVRRHLGRTTIRASATSASTRPRRSSTRRGACTRRPTFRAGRRRGAAAVRRPRSPTSSPALGWLHLEPRYRRGAPGPVARHAGTALLRRPAAGLASAATTIAGRQRLALAGEWDGHTTIPYLVASWPEFARELTDAAARPHPRIRLRGPSGHTVDGMDVPDLLRDVRARTRRRAPPCARPSRSTCRWRGRRAARRRLDARP